MIRLFYLVSSIDSAQEISDDLHEHGVTDWHSSFNDPFASKRRRIRQA